MSREIRITVDDDEVFERMKARKRELDLSWEEVLHRGLGHGRGPGPGGPVGLGPRGHRHAHEEYHSRPGRHREHDRDPGHHGREHEGPDRWDQFATGLEREIQDKVYDTLAASFGAAGIDVPDRPGLDEEVETLTSAEDATLAFEFLEDREAYEVPLRVNLETGPDGLVVDVVAVRRGKDVRGANSFDIAGRKRVNTRLAAGDAAVLRFGDGAESYRVRPVLSWTRAEDGRPTVDAVEIDEVLLDVEE